MNIQFWQKEKIMQNNLDIQNNNYYFVALGAAEVQPTTLKKQSKGVGSVNLFTSLRNP